jgi:hypothetical protein
MSILSMREAEIGKIKEVRNLCGCKYPGTLSTFRKHLEEWVGFSQIQMEVKNSASSV